MKERTTMSDERGVSQSAIAEQVYYLLTIRISQRLWASKIDARVSTAVIDTVQALILRQIRALVLSQAEEDCRDER
jgi:hypothetical protein